jgi:DNA-binding transcriptional LysR family regulator
MFSIPIDFSYNRCTNLVLVRSFPAFRLKSKIMTLHQLRIFECVARQLNVTKASMALHLSQPSVSQQLRLLEGEFGKTFFVRLNQGMELTGEGKEFLKAILPLLATAEKIDKRFKANGKTNDGGLLIVGGSRNVSGDILPKLLVAFKKRRPSAQFVLESGHSPAIEKRLIASEFDIGLITNPSYHPEIIYEPYQEMELVAFCISTNPVARRKLSLKDLLECPLVLRGGGKLEKVVANLGYKLNVAMRCEASTSVQAAVLMGMGVGILYRGAVASQVASGNLTFLNVPELKEMGIKSFIIHDKRKPLAPISLEFLRVMHEQKNTELAATHKPVLVHDRRLLIQ